MARTRDISQVRSYVQRQFQKILAGAKHNMADFVFCKEVRLGTYAADRKPLADEGPEDEEEFDVEGGQRPHSAIIALQRIQQDPRDTPQHGERVPYVIVYGQGNDKLRELVASPDDLARNPYVPKQLPLCPYSLGI
jgi:DNA polymerase zeta